jgi:hypothetical protein
MKTSLLPLSIAAVAAALAGCEWGGVHSGESWNDAYSWANFSGTYKLVTTITPTDGSGSSTSSTTTTTSTSTTGSGSGSGGSTTTTHVVTNIVDVNWSGKYSGNTTTYGPGKSNILVGSVTITVAGLEGSFSDASGVLTYSGSTANSATFDYKTGHFTLTLVNDAYFMGRSVKLTAQQQTLKTVTDSSGSGTTNNGDGTTTTTTTTTTTNGDGSSTTTTTATKTSYIQWLNLTQKGNLLTFKDNYGTTYSGRITGASCPTADQGGYITAAHVRFPFEATCTSDSRITLSGSLSGDWSGGSSATSGTLANRTIDATYHTGRSAAQFQAVSGTVTISPQEIAPYAGTTN